METDVVVLVLVAGHDPVVVCQMPRPKEARVQALRQRLDRRDEFHGLGRVADSMLPACVAVPIKALGSVALVPDFVPLYGVSQVADVTLLGGFSWSGIVHRGAPPSAPR